MQFRITNIVHVRLATEFSQNSKCEAVYTYAWLSAEHRIYNKNNFINLEVEEAILWLHNYGWIISDIWLQWKLWSRRECKWLALYFRKSNWSIQGKITDSNSRTTHWTRLGSTSAWSILVSRKIYWTHTRLKPITIMTTAFTKGKSLVTDCF